jgi:hypothetical protein
MTWELLAPLLKKRDTWYLLVILALLLAFRLEHAARKVDEAVIAARPAVHTEAEQHVQIVRVSGPVRVETKTVYVPGTNQVQYVERIAERGASTTTTQKESQVVKDVKPACPPAPRAPWRYVSAALDVPGLTPRRLGAGVTWYGRLDTGLDYDFKYHAAGLDLRVRF